MRRYFISFPKSGRTWMRYMLMSAGVSDKIQFHHDGFEYNNGSKPTLDFDIEKRLRLYSKTDRVVYMERTPGDVMVSLYYQVTGRFRDFFNYGGTLSDFLRDDYFGVENLVRFQSMWREIVAIRGFHLITYERCHAEPVEVLRGVMEYYGWNICVENLYDIAANATFEKMKEIENSGEFPEPWLRLRNGSPKVRHGRVGSYRTELSEKDCEYLNKILS